MRNSNKIDLDKIYKTVKNSDKMCVPLSDRRFSVVLNVKPRVQNSLNSERVILKTIQTINPFEEKIIRYESSQLETINNILNREIECLWALDNKFNHNLSKYFILPIITSGFWQNNTHHTAKNIAMFKDGFPAFIMPKGKGLQIYIKEKLNFSISVNPISPLNFIRWSFQITTAINALHSLRDNDGNLYVHRDIKPSNFVLQKDSVYLIDVGGVIKKKIGENTNSFMGSFVWSAPELIIPYKKNINGELIYKYDQQVDLFGIGLMMFWLLTISSKEFNYLKCQLDIMQNINSSGQPIENGYLKWGEIGGLTYAEQKKLKLSLKKMFPVIGDGKIDIFTDIRSEFYNLIVSLLDADPSKRPTGDNVIQRVQKFL